MTTAWQTASTDAIVIDGTIYRTADRFFMVRPASRVRLVGYEPDGEPTASGEAERVGT